MAGITGRTVTGLGLLLIWLCATAAEPLETESSIELRIDAPTMMAALVTTHRPAVADLLLDRLNDSALRATAIRGLAGFDRGETGAAILNRYSKLSDAEKLDAVSTLTAREKTALALVAAVDAGSMLVPGSHRQIT